MSRPDQEPPATIDRLRRELDFAATGQALHDRARRLFPICRSITGDGVRQTLRVVQEHVDLRIHEVPTGTPVFDWTVPQEWNIRDAWVKDQSGRRVVDFHASSLHVLNYSVPIHTRIPLAELQPHLFSIPEYPDWIPYKTWYYNRNWGFCLTERQRLGLVDDEVRGVHRFVPRGRAPDVR